MNVNASVLYMSQSRVHPAVWSGDVVRDTLHKQFGDTYCLVEMFKGTVVMKNKVDLKQYIHLDNPYNREKLR